MSVSKIYGVPSAFLIEMLRYSTDKEMHNFLTTSSNFACMLIHKVDKLFMEANYSVGSQLGLLKWHRLHQFFPLPLIPSPLTRLSISDRTLKNPISKDPIEEVGEEIENLLLPLNFTALRTLSLSTGTVEESTLFSIIERSPLQHVELDLSSSITPRVWNLLYEKKLTHLKLNGDVYTYRDKGFPYRQIGKCYIISNEISSPRLLDFDLAFFDYRTLNYLHFQSINELTDAVASRIGPALSSLEKLKIVFCEQLKTGITHLFVPTLKEVTLLSQPVGNEECQSLLERAQKLEKLTIMHWIDTSLSNETMQGFAQFPTLTRLNLQFSRIQVEEGTLNDLKAKYGDRLTIISGELSV